MARKWAMRLAVVGAVFLFLVMPGVSVGHGDPGPGMTAPAKNTFVQVWWFMFWTEARQSTVSNIVVGVAIAAFLAFAVGVGMLIYGWRHRGAGHGTDRTDDSQ